MIQGGGSGDLQSQSSSCQQSVYQIDNDALL